jgi:hypothetical protein
MKRGIYSIVAVVQILLLAVVSSTARAEEDTAGGYVTRKEYEELKAELLALKKELAGVKKEAHAAVGEEKTEDQVAADLHKQVLEPVVAEQKEAAIGTTNFLLTGFGVGTFEDREGSASNFSASFNPIFLWELSPRLLYEGRLELELSGSGTNLELEYSLLTYLVNDYITLGAGEFLTPSNVFVERFEPLWINKLPDRPLAVYDGLLGERSIGAEVRGGFPIGPTRANYSFYVSNGPNLNVFDPTRAGTLDFNNFTDNNDNKAVGGRVGFLPFPGVEIGYGFEVSNPGAQGSSFADVGAFLQTVDLNITRGSDLLKGRVDIHAQYVWSKVDSAVYDPTGVFGFGPLEFESKRDGGYAQIAYRPTQAGLDFLRDFEFIFRWDHLSRAPSGLGVGEEQRWTLGIDYWITSAVALKTAYQWDQRRGEPNANAFFVQTAAGF